MTRQEALHELAIAMNVDAEWLAEVLTSLMGPRGAQDWEYSEGCGVALPVASNFCIVTEIVAHADPLETYEQVEMFRPAIVVGEVGDEG
jgi:hypothetical protein